MADTTGTASRLLDLAIHNTRPQEIPSRESDATESSSLPSSTFSDEINYSILDAHLKEMPSNEWLNKGYSSFIRLEQIIRPCWNTEPTPQEDLDEDVKKIRAVREGSLPAICILPAGNHALRFTALSEPCECIAFGTMGPKLFIELFWEAVSKAQDAGEAIVVHEVQSFVPRCVVSVGNGEFERTFEMRYVQCETLIRRYPDICSAPDQFLDDRKNCSQNVQYVVKDLKKLSRWFLLSSEDHRRAYHYVRAWAIQKGLFNTKPGFNAQDFIRVCDPGVNGAYIHGESHTIIAQFFRTTQIATGLTLLEITSEEDCERALLAAEKEALYLKLNFPYYIRVSLMYTGPSKAKGGEWLSMVDRKVFKLKERLEARIANPEIRIWPQRLVSSKSDLNDDIYEGYVVIGLRCLEIDVPLAREVSERWRIQVDEDSLLLKGQCYISITIFQRSSAIQEEDLKPDTRVWPKSVIKPEENRSEHDNDSEEQEKAKKGKASITSPAKGNNSGMKGAKLRQASDILNRLRYDREYNIDDCVVGYKDRHTSKIKEKPVADWASETTDEEFIPEHRIEYFKHDGAVIWDKNLRVDKVFDSGS